MATHFYPFNQRIYASYSNNVSIIRSLPIVSNVQTNSKWIAHSGWILWTMKFYRTKLRDSIWFVELCCHYLNRWDIQSKQTSMNLLLLNRKCAKCVHNLCEKHINAFYFSNMFEWTLVIFPSFWMLAFQQQQSNMENKVVIFDIVFMKMLFGNFTWTPFY